MSFECVKDNVSNLVKGVYHTAANAAHWTCKQAVGTVKWSGRQVVWLKDTVVGWHLPSKFAGGVKWSASKVNSIWNKILPLLKAVGAFLVSPLGICLSSLAAAGGLLYASRNVAWLQANNGLQITAQVGALFFAFASGAALLAGC